MNTAVSTEDPAQLTVPEKVALGEPLTMQELFDHACRFLAAQGEPAYLSGLCRYQTDDGRKCAVGCLLPDDFDYLDYQGGIISMADEGILPSSLSYHIPFLHRLQEVHDYAGHRSMDQQLGLRFTHRFWKTMSEVAGDYGLNDNVLLEVGRF
jgi:hypothetical protein